MYVMPYLPDIPGYMLLYLAGGHTYSGSAGDIYKAQDEKGGPKEAVLKRSEKKQMHG